MLFVERFHYVEVDIPGQFCHGFHVRLVFFWTTAFFDLVARIREPYKRVHHQLANLLRRDGVFNHLCPSDPWHNRTMPTRSSTDRDFAVNAFRVVEQAIGEHMDGTPLENLDASKNQAAVALGRLGGKKGGKARAAKLSPERRKAIAKKAAAARWKQ
jgi:hypothetical protein